MEQVPDFLSWAGWLYTRIYQNALFFFDLWSVVHFWSGMLIYLFLKALKAKRPLSVLILILILYEVIEILFTYFAFYIFRPETLKDQVTDILLGTAGGLFIVLLLRIFTRYREKYPTVISAVIILLASISCAFPWVGFSHYHYNVAFLNSPGMNYSAFLAWMVVCFIIMSVFRYFIKKKILIRLMFTWVIYMIFLMIFAYAVNVISGVYDIDKAASPGLIFGLLRGSATLHLFYLIGPFIVIAVYSIAVWLFRKGMENGEWRMENGELTVGSRQ